MFHQFKKLAKNSLIYSLGNLSTKILGLILLPIYTSHLNVADYGLLGILEVSAQFITAVFGLNLYRALTRWYWENFDEIYHKELFYTVLIFLLILVLLLEVLFWLFAPALSRVLFSATGYAYLLRLMAISAGLNIIFNIPLTLMRIQEKPVLYSVSNIIKLIVAGVLTIIFIVSMGKGVAGIYEAQIIAAGVFFAILFPYILKNIKTKFLPETLWEMFLFSYPLVFASVSGLLLTIADRFFLKFISGLTDVGIYSLGYKIANSIRVFAVQSIMLALSPIIYKQMNAPDSRLFYARLMKYLGLLVMILVLVLSIFSTEIVHLLAKAPGYWKADLIIPIVAMAVFFTMLKEVSLTGLNIKKKTKIVAWIISEVAVLNLILNYLLIPPYQSVGAAAATLISQIVLFGHIYYAAQKEYKIPYDLNDMFKLFLLASLIILLAFGLGERLTLLYSLMFKTFLMALFFFLLPTIGFFKKEEIAKLKSTINKNVRK